MNFTAMMDDIFFFVFIQTRFMYSNNRSILSTDQASCKGSTGTGKFSVQFKYMY